MFVNYWNSQIGGFMKIEIETATNGYIITIHQNMKIVLKENCNSRTNTIIIL